MAGADVAPTSLYPPPAGARRSQLRGNLAAYPGGEAIFPAITVTFRVDDPDRPHHLPLLLPVRVVHLPGELRMGIVLAGNQYGKAQTRLLRLSRDGDRHALTDLNVSIALAGDLVPTRHHLPVDLSTFGDACEPNQKYSGDACEPNQKHSGDACEPNQKHSGLKNANEVFVAADRPYGLIEGTVIREDAPPAGDAW